jgi:hypothetical protein
LSIGLDRGAHWRCCGDCDSLASLSALTALFIRYWIFWQIEGRNAERGGGLLYQPHQVFVHRYGDHVISGLREIFGFCISVKPFGSGFNSLEFLESRWQRIWKSTLAVDRHWL